MTLARILLAVAALAGAVYTLAPASAETSTIRLSPGQNVVTWNGAEPYPIAEFADTPVTQIHRWDVVGQEWLSHFVGQYGATLPELHLLPRVQYLLLAGATYDLTVPDPIAGVDPRAALRFTAPPNDPLRFEAYWPNEDSPLEDLVVLRGEDERLSVEAEIAGGSGNTEVYWVIDGRVNHVGLSSDDVELTPGAHDHARLVAVDGIGQVAVVQLPRVVKLPPLELPEMTYGTHAAVTDVAIQRRWATELGHEYAQNWELLATVLNLIADAGFTAIRTNLSWQDVEGHSQGEYDEALLASYDRLFEEIAERGLDVMAVVSSAPKWSDVRAPASTHLGGVAVDSRDYGEFVRFAAARWPEIRWWVFHEEPNSQGRTFYLTRDPYRAAHDSRQGALAAYYASPNSITMGGNLSPIVGYGPFPRDSWQFLQQMFEVEGFAELMDTIGYHLFACPIEEGHNRSPMSRGAFIWHIDETYEVMVAHGDADAPLFVSSTGWSTAPTGHRGAVSSVVQAECIRSAFSILSQLDYVAGAVQFRFLDDSKGYDTWSYWLGLATKTTAASELDGAVTPKPAYWAVREFITGKPPPAD